MSDSTSSIKVLENTSPVIADLNCGIGDNPDLGTDICAVTDKDSNGFGEDTEKPTSYILSLGALSDTLVTSATGDALDKVNSKVEVGAIGGTDDGDGSYYIVVSKDDDPDKTDNLFFSGTVEQGASFEAAGSFGSETFIHIFSADGGSLLQTINYHTSCSSPLIIGDQYGSITLQGATLEGKDSGTLYTVGLSEVAGDAGVVYEITGGNDADDFEVDPDTGVVTFKNPPDYENPTDSDGDNKYDVIVSGFEVDENGVKTGEVCEVRPLEVCVEDDCIKVLENTSPVIADLNCGIGDNPDFGTDICAVTDKDSNGFGEDTEKPTSYILSLGALSDTLVTSATGDALDKVNSKVEVGAIGGTDDGDGSYYIVVSKDDDPDKTDNLFFSGTVEQGASFEASGSFGSETFIHIFSADGGSLLQTINYHTSCSSPLIIGDQYGSITLQGATLEGKDSGTLYTVGLSEVAGDAGVVYEITGGNDADDFEVDPDTGVVTFKNPPDYENPTDSDGDNKYDVIVSGFEVDENGVKTGEVCEVRPLEVCVEDDCIKVLENTSPVIADLNCGIGDNPDFGTDICAVTDKDSNGFGEDTEKPTSYILSLGALSDTLVTSATGDALDKVNSKVEVGAIGGTDDGDGSYYIVVSKDDDPDKTDNLFFSGTVEQGASFEAAGSFGSETFIHIFSADGGSLLQTINYHTSCSSPLIIGDQYGSITLQGATLEGKDSGTLYTVGVSEVAGDAGVVYEITGGNDADDFVVDAATGEVTFKNTPDFENPTDANGDNKYDVIVSGFEVDENGVKTGEVCDIKVLEVCVEDQECIVILENTTDAGVLADLDCEDQPTNPDVGLEICAERERLKDVEGIDTTKPTQLTFTLNESLQSIVETGQPDGKFSISDFGLSNADGGGLYVVVSEDNDPTKTDAVYFAGDVGFGESFTVDGGGEFRSNTYLHIFDQQDGTLLQTVQYHTSCSAPITIGDKLGLVSLEGVGLENKDTGTPIVYGGSVPTDVEYVITAGDGYDPVTETSPFFNVDPETGEVTLAFSPDFENPLDDNGDNSYFVEVTGYIVNPDGSRGEVCEVKPVEICIEDVPEFGSLSGRYFCDDNNNGRDDGEPGIQGVTVELLDDMGNGTGITTMTAADGSYSFGNLAPGSYGVKFSYGGDKTLIEKDAPGSDDTNDSDATDLGMGMSEITGIIVTAGNDTPDNDAGVETRPGSLSGRYFCDDNNNGRDDGEPGIQGVTVELLDDMGNGTGITTMTAADGSYSFGNLAPGSYGVKFSYGGDKTLIEKDAPGSDDTNDSDATDLGMGMSEITGITVVAGANTPDNDAGVETKPGSLSGRYFCDDNNNGRDDGEPGIAGVTVELLDSAGNPTGATVMTAADGSYSFGNLAPGSYGVKFTYGGDKTLIEKDAPGSDDTNDSDATDLGMGMSEITGITVVAGANTPDNDAGVETKPGSLSGRYFCDDNNNGRDDGEPGIAGVTVELLDSAGDPTGATVMTAADGSYSFGNLAPGSYGVKFTYGGDKTLIEKDAPGSDDTNDSDATDLGMGMSEITGIIVTAGNDTPDNDAGVETKPGSLSGRYFCDDNNNGRDDGEPGIAGVTVELLDSAGDPTGATVMTAADGSYSFGNLAPGSYGVKFTYAGDKTLIEKDAPGSDDTNDSDATDLGMGMSEITGITVVAGANTPDNDAGVETKPGSLSGRYFCDDNNNGRDDGEPGIAGVTVELLDSAGDPTGATVMTAADGSYSFGNLAPGSYGVKFTYAGDKTLIEKDAPGSDDTNDSDATDLGMGMSEITGITVVAGANTPDNDAGVETKPGSLSGRYFCDDNNNGRDDGEPGIAGVTVELLDSAGNPTGATVMTAADGSYSFGNLAPGSYGVKFTYAGDKTLIEKDAPGSDDTNDSDATDLGMGMSEITGITVVAGANTPDNDAGVETKPGSLSGRYFCDDNNNGRDDGEPGIAGVTVELLDSAGDPTGATVMTAADGSYSFGNLAPGSYGVKFTYAGDKTLIEKDAPGSDDTNDSDATDLGMGMSEITGITVVAGANTPDNDAGVETKPGSLSGRYFCDDNNNGRDDGEPGIAGVTVELLDSAGDPTGATVMTAADGSYSFGNLAPGSYGVKFSYGGDKTLIEKDAPGSDDTNDSDATDLGMGMSEITGITVVAGANTPDNDAGVETKPGSLSGRYFCDDNNNGRDDGEPGIQGVTVELLDDMGNGTGITTMTAADGSYSFGNLAPGSYGVKFTYGGDKTLIEKDAPGSDDTNDSDATDLGMGMSEITGITVVAGANTPDNDAGVETKPGSLSGRYFCDDNNNGRDDGEPGIQGVTVELLDDMGNGTGITTMTAADGSYSFGNLAPGSYGVKFTYGGDKTLIEKDAPGSDDTNDSDATDLGMGMSEITGIIVTAGNDTPDNDAGVETRPGSLSGRYFCDDNNNGRDDGEPGIQGVTVELLDDMGNGTGITTMTAADGSYSFGNLAPGSYGVKFSYGGDKTLIEKDAPGSDDTNDSDATDLGMGMSEITGIIVTAGNDTPDNDAGVETRPGSLSGRYFCDDNNNGRDDGEPGIQGVTVELLDDMGNGTGITTMTAADGSYSFGNLAPGSYGVKFSYGGDKTLIEKDAPGSDDTNDSDATDLGMGMSQILGITVNAGMDTPDNDAGVEQLNRPPEPTPDEAMICYDEAIAVDVLTNDSDPDMDSLMVKAVNGMLIGVNDPKLIDGVEVTLNADGTLTFDAGGKDGPMGHLLTGQEETRQYTYTVDDGNGGMATTTVDVTFCGATDTIEKVFTLLPVSVKYQVRDENKDQDGNLDDFIFEKGPEAFTVNVIDASMILAGTFVSAYCLSYNDAVASIPQQEAFAGEGSPLQLMADVKLADADTVGADLVDQVGINGQTAAANLDLINWIVNQRFENQDNGDGPGFEAYTDFEIQAAIWALTDGQDLASRGAVDGIVLLPDPQNGIYGTKENAQEIVDAAIANGEGFAADAAAGDLVGVFLDADNQPPAANVQPFIVGYDLSDLFDDCIC